MAGANNNSASSKNHDASRDPLLETSRLLRTALVLGGRLVDRTAPYDGFSLDTILRRLFGATFF